MGVPTVTGRVAPVLVLVLALALALVLAACDASPPPPTAPTDAASPNAAILPAPLATEPPDLFDGGAGEAGARPSPADSAGRPSLVDASSPTPSPETMLPATPLPAEAIPFAREVPGVTVDAAFRWRDVPPPPRAPEVSIEGLREAQKVAGLTLKVDLSEAGRMRAELTGAAFPLAPHTELRARSDHYGNLLVWPGATGYRVVPPGALRPVLGERRMDVTPLTPSSPRPQGEGRRLGIAVRKVELGSSIATIRLELGKVPESGEGGALLCRALVELGGVDPRTSACQPGEVPLSAAYSWQEGGGITFEVSAVTKRTDLASAALLTPPPGLIHLSSGLPGVPRGIFLGRETLTAFRTAAITLPTPRDPQVPGEGFVAVNPSDRLMIFLLDSVPVLWVPAHGDQYVVGPHRGRYLGQWRSFLGEKVAPPQPVEIPGRFVHGGPVDGGAPLPPDPSKPARPDGGPP
jgi:hypothetical protein